MGDLAQKLTDPDGEYMWKIEEIPNNFRKLGRKGALKVFQKHGYSTMLNYFFGHSPYLAFDFIYPCVFKPWEFSPNILFHHIKPGETKKDRAAYATRCFAEERLGIPPENIRYVLNYSKDELENLMVEYGIGGVGGMFHRSMYRIFDNAYPNTFREGDFMSAAHKRNIYA